MKNKKFIFFLLIFGLPCLLHAANLDNLKADFLKGNYRRVIFEGQPLAEGINFGNNEELNYLLGLSYLKVGDLPQAQNYFKRILNSSSGKIKSPANLALADTYLLGGDFAAAEDIYGKLIQENPNTLQKAAILYRYSQLENKKGNHRLSNEYFLKLKKDFPLSPELKLNKDLAINVLPKPSAKEAGQYCVQVGFFSSSNNANNFKDKLISKGYLAYLERTEQGFRVKVGRFNDPSQALDLEKQLTQEGFQTKLCP